jgi:hypothetical protein
VRVRRQVAALLWSLLAAAGVVAAGGTPAAATEPGPASRPADHPGFSYAVSPTTPLAVGRTGPAGKPTGTPQPSGAEPRTGAAPPPAAHRTRSAAVPLPPTTTALRMPRGRAPPELPAPARPDSWPSCTRGT